MSRDAEETESKHEVLDVDLLLERLTALGYHGGDTTVHVDEYYDTVAESLTRDDFVVRLRITSAETLVAFKGPRRNNPDGTYTRVEVELPVDRIDAVRAALTAQRLECRRRIEKRRREFRKCSSSLIVAFDEVPCLGNFIELEGDPDDIRAATAELGDMIGTAERRNYYELLADRWVQQGNDIGDLTGTSFADC